jgi:hypothetical protein
MEYKGGKMRIIAENRDEAFAKFFKDVIEGKISLDDLGNIIILHDRKEQYGFRTVPLLWQMKLIDKQTAIANIIACTGAETKEAEKMLYKYSFDDSRLIPLIEKLRESEAQ